MLQPGEASLPKGRTAPEGAVTNQMQRLQLQMFSTA